MNLLALSLQVPPRSTCHPPLHDVMSRRTPHQVLGVPDYATKDEIKHAYRAQVLHWHPDRLHDDKHLANRCFAEVNQAYKTLTRTMDLESNFEEPLVMNPGKDGQKSTRMQRRHSSSSSSSSFSYDSEDDSSDSRLSLSTPSSSFKDSPTTCSWPSTPFTPSPYRPEHKAPSSTYESWRAGPDLPEAFKHKAYIPPSHLSHSKPGMTAFPKPPRRPPTPAHPGAPSSPHTSIQRHASDLSGGT
ncbi:hypothetical protein CC1G_14446 [Coprinopsis cinerea okayama7|uniref:J domain-containing protein n=1 Tax=Coprinopsis cinerea (strain Okayama-7 / 130 / ATCC MYA-4618 / FGSC 9003) TaxID=240176 RepID=D6RLU1_COPC7|nr:hypothetical protein CC1G_14446 [Coprinopsis cinerea okayama7\|eukprot:XP_002911449.1 hypothetical protein CC1G_14446 [Coprinopsis cinerea okayama7\